MNQGTELPPPPGFRDWAIFAIGVAFVVGGCFIAKETPRDALYIIAFFGVCSLSSGYTIFRKLRRRRFTATTALAPGGVKLQGSNSRTLLLAAMIAVPGLTIFAVDAPMLIRICGWIMVGAAAVLLFMVATGRVSRRFIRFDPLGLTLGETKFEYTVPWDQMANILEFEMHSNAAVGFEVPQPESILVTPESARPRVYKLLGQNQGYYGPNVVIMVSQFATTAEALCAALRTYAEDAQARAGLVPRPALGG